MAWLTAVEDMGTPALQRELRRQRVSFWLAFFNVCSVMACANVEACFEFMGDSQNARRVFWWTLNLLPIWGLSWFVGFVLVTQSLMQCKRATWYGLVALAVHVTPLLGLAVIVVVSFWNFFSSL